MSTEANKATVHRIYEIISTGKLDEADEIFAPDFVIHEMPEVQSLADLKRWWPMLRTAFPDVRFFAEDTIAAGDKVVTRFTMKGTNQGEFMDIPPTSKQVVVHGIEIGRFRDGKAVEHWGILDRLGMMEQLGIISSPG